MIYRLYILFDKAAQATFGPLIPCHRDEEAIRQFRDVLASPKTLPNAHPLDFALYVLAEFDTTSMHIDRIESQYEPQLVYTGAEHINQLAKSEQIDHDQFNLEGTR